MLAASLVGCGDRTARRILVESTYATIDGTQDSLYQIPSFVSENKSTFFAFINDLESVKFDKAALFNLVDTAEKYSCERVIFVLLADNNDLSAFEKKLELIDAVEMSSSQTATICEPESQDFQNFKFYELML